MGEIMETIGALLVLGTLGLLLVGSFIGAWIAAIDEWQTHNDSFSLLVIGFVTLLIVLCGGGAILKAMGV